MARGREKRSHKPRGGLCVPSDVVRPSGFAGHITLLLLFANSAAVLVDKSTGVENETVPASECFRPLVTRGLRYARGSATLDDSDQLICGTARQRVSGRANDWYAPDMSIPARLDDIPNQKAIEKALGRLCTNALLTWWILETGGVLLSLDCVHAHLSANSSSEKDYARALRKYLETAVARVESRRHRIILEVVLGLGDEKWKTKEWRKQKTKTRRAEAGRRFRGEGTVKQGTIRQHHEPRAIQALSIIVLEDERLARNKPVDDGNE